MVEVRRAMHGKDCLFYEVKKNERYAQNASVSNKYQK